MSKDKQGNEQDSINNPNDKFFKKLFGLASVVRDYFDHLFPKHLAAKLNLNTLELDNTTYITSELEEYFSDIVWRCQFLGKETAVHICFIFEHKSYVPEYPHIQIGDYKQGAYNKQLAAKQPLSVVVPIIIYHGKRKWVEKPFSDYFGDVDEEFHQFIDPYEYYLTNLQDYSDEMIQAFMRSLSVYLSNISGGITKIEIYYQIEQLNDNLNKENMYNFMEELKAEGIEIGIEKGIEKGVELGKKMSIYQVHLAGHDIESLSHIFALPSAEISQIIQEVKNIELLKSKAKN